MTRAIWIARQYSLLQQELALQQEVVRRRGEDDFREKIYHTRKVWYILAISDSNKLIAEHCH